MTTLIAIDAGGSGGIAVWRDGPPTNAVLMPLTEGDLVSLLRQLETARRQGKKPHRSFFDRFTKSTLDAQAALYRKPLPLRFKSLKGTSNNRVFHILNIVWRTTNVAKYSFD